MGDNNQVTTLSNEPAASDKGKGKAAQDPTVMDVSMDEGESDESENEDIMEEEDEEDGDNLEPISADNIIDGGRRTRGKSIDFQKAAEKLKDDEGDDDEDDEDFAPDDNDDSMRD
ncbi:Histone H2A.Z-specific chaperone [Aspergillus alliaceus]|uniref:Histone H2A.Z-specific chaperone n=1 Tax=Petromyces alliaceus TaxID=209559 RepID=A0A8H6E882_PETAA|nr:Histone H2A.Z-specific chaperone [Aspergillus burnettii]